jgi:hypothetical protein
MRVERTVPMLLDGSECAAAAAAAAVAHQCLHGTTPRKWSGGGSERLLEACRAPMPYWATVRFCDGCPGRGARSMSHGLRVLVKAAIDQAWPEAAQKVINLAQAAVAAIRIAFGASCWRSTLPRRRST